MIKTITMKRSSVLLLLALICGCASLAAAQDLPYQVRPIHLLSSEKPRIGSLFGVSFRCGKSGMYL